MFPKIKRQPATLLKTFVNLHESVHTGSYLLDAKAFVILTERTFTSRCLRHQGDNQLAKY